MATKKNTNKKNNTTKKSTVVKGNSVAKEDTKKKKTASKVDTNKNNKITKKETTVKKDKDLKKERKKIEEIDSNVEGSFAHDLFVISGVVIFICVFYFLTLYITTKNKKVDNNNTNNTEASEVFSYSDIMVGRSFSISDGEYYVIYYDKSNDEVSSDCSSMVSSYSAKEDGIDIYTVDMSDGLNKKYAGEESNSNPTKASEIVINGPTLIKFNNDEVVDYVEGIDSIKGYLE